MRGLEEYFGVSLVYRQGKSMALTGEGTQLAAKITQGFTTIQQGVRDLQSRQEKRPLQLAVTPSFASNWLMPRLGDFWQKNPDIEIALYPSTNLVDLRNDEIDLAIRFGNGNWPGHQVTHLISGQFIVAGAPKLIRNLKTRRLQDLHSLPWLMQQGRNETKLWLQSHGFDLEQAKITYLPTIDLVIAAAREGYGLMLEYKPLLLEDISAGRLELLFEDNNSDYGYYLLTRRSVATTALKHFLRWIKASV